MSITNRGQNFNISDIDFERRTLVKELKTSNGMFFFTYYSCKTM